MFWNHPHLRELDYAFRTNGFEIRIVGGAVRDYLLGIEPKDVDLCTTATPNEMRYVAKRSGFHIVPTGEEYGTMTFVVEGEPYEITTLRMDVETDGRRAVVAYTTCWETDAERRDLTINQMSMELDGTLYDYFGGREDLEARRVRFVGDAETRIREDYLRVLRFFRFMARFEAQADTDTLTLFSENFVRTGLAEISKERVWQEMSKLLTYKDRLRVLDLMFTTGLAKPLGLDPVQYPAVFARARDAVEAMSLLVSDPKFGKTWKMSSDESKRLEFLVNARWSTHPAALGVSNTDHVERLLAFGTPRDHVVSVSRLYFPDVVDHAAGFQVPMFPVSGDDLKAQGMKPGPEMGAKLRDMKQRWVLSGFTLTAEDLLK